MDVTAPEQAQIAEDAGAAEMALYKRIFAQETGHNPSA